MMTDEIRIMRGPNMWSGSHHHLIALKYDPQSIPKITSSQHLLISNYFSSNYNFISKYDDFGLCLFDYTLHLASLLQGESHYHDIISPSKGIFYGILEYDIEQAGLESLNLAKEIIQSLIINKIPVAFDQARKQVQAVRLFHSEGPSSAMIIEAARKRNIPVCKGPAGYTVLGYGNKQKRVSAAISHNTSCIAVDIACNKEHTKLFLQSANIPVPAGRLVKDESELAEVAEKIGYPLVTKPFNGNQGRNVTCGISNFQELLTGYRCAAEISKAVMVEKEIKGYDYRILVVGHRFVAASLRQPACVLGDGRSTVSELVEAENLNPLRGEGHENVLTKISIDSAAELQLQKQGFHLQSVPEKGQLVFLKSTANLSTGGTAEDVTDSVHPSNILLAEKVSRVIGLDVCGIDIMSPDISLPLAENGGAVIEVNAAPGLRMHKYPSKGMPREVGLPIIDLMFPSEDEGRIPIVAITGTNGKTTTTRLMAHLASFAGHTVGFSSTDGIYIGNERVVSGDCSGPQSAHTILQDPTVDFAVLECARGGIIRSGLGFDQCDIAIVTNVAADHLGLKDINTVEDLANVKVVVPRTVKKDGWAILNAGDEHSCAMKDRVECKIALFCGDESNPKLQEHMRNGGVAVYADSSRDIFIWEGSGKQFILNAADAPVTCGGKAEFMIENLLPVVLAGYLSGIQVEQIAAALTDFVPGAEQTPGRINEFEIGGVNVIVDYAHNPHGLKALAGYLRNLTEKKIGIIAVPGDRRDDDIIEFGQIAAGMYDDIIIRFDQDMRGRSEASIVELLEKGIRQVKQEIECKVIADVLPAVHFAMEHSEPGDYVVICADNAIQTVELIKNINFKKDLIQPD